MLRILAVVLVSSAVLLVQLKGQDNNQDIVYYTDNDDEVHWNKNDKLPHYEQPQTSHLSDFEFYLHGGMQDRNRNNVKYMVSIRTSHAKKYFGDNHFCAGVIIASKLVLTAAHCVVDRNKMITRPHRLLVVAGTSNRLRRDKTTIEMIVEDVVPHKKFRRHGAHDIAILKLYKGVPMDNEGVKIMPMISAPPTIGLTCFVLGWGQMYAHGPFAAEVLQSSYNIVRSDVCAPYVSSSCLTGILCGRNELSNKGEACSGDSGGPLMFGETLVGIISQGISCGGGLPTIFTDVYSHRQWINSVSASAVRNCALITMLLLMILLSLYSLVSWP